MPLYPRPWTTNPEPDKTLNRPQRRSSLHNFRIPVKEVTSALVASLNP